MVDPERWGSGVDSALLSAAEWAACVFGGSETAVALLTSPPGRAAENVLTNDDIASAREIVDRYSGSSRVLTHAIVHPNLGESELDAMAEWSSELAPAGWKVYTLWGPPETGFKRLLLRRRGVRYPVPRTRRALARASSARTRGSRARSPTPRPRARHRATSGPAAGAFPDLTFVVYHSGYDIDPVEEGAHADDPHRGVSRLVTSLADAGVAPGANVYAELGSTWFLMLRRPREAAHVLGKLLLAVGEDRILWGTDSVWYGPPQSLIDAFRASKSPSACKRSSATRRSPRP